MKKIKKQIILAITMLFMVLAVCNAAAAADVSNNDTMVQTQDQTASQSRGHNSTDTGSISTNTVESYSTNHNSTNTSSVNMNTIKQPSKVVISGQVKKCSSGAPFPGVIVTAEKNGTELASTTTNEDGTYNLEFLSDGSTFNITASYPGHESSSKEVNVIRDSNGTLQGTADFQLGVPTTFVDDNWVGLPAGTIVFFPGDPNPHTIGTDAFATISDGVTNANPGGTVHIADGTYQGAANRGITLNKDLTIIGQSQAGTVIDAQNADRIFTIPAGVTVTIHDLTFTNGQVTGNGGAINNAGTLTVNNCTFTGNIASGIFPPNGLGGAIVNDFGTLTVNDCTFTGNTAYASGAIDNHFGTVTVNRSTFDGNSATLVGGAISSAGPLNINDSTFTGNTAQYGGAINNDFSTLTVNNSTFTGNSADGGGAILSNGGSVTIKKSNFTNNTAGNAGGGAIGTTNTLMAVNDSTFIDNTCPTWYGGAIAKVLGTLTITSSTFKNNSARYGGAISSYGDYEIHFSTITGNTALIGSATYNFMATVNAENNWWGSNVDPRTVPNQIYIEAASFDADPWLILSIAANPTTINNGGISQVTADLLHDSNGVYHDPALGHVPDGIPITLTTDWGSFTNPGITHSVTLGTVNGSVTATFYANEGPTPSPPLNPVKVTATADGYTTNDEESAYITILEPPVPPTTPIIVNIIIGDNASILSPHQSQTSNNSNDQVQTQTSINTNANNLTNDNLNTATGTSYVTNTNNISNINTFDPVINLNNSNYVGNISVSSSNINLQSQTVKQNVKVAKKHKRHHRYK